MADLEDGETIEVQGSAAQPYLLRNTGGVYSCTCPAWRNQSVGIERRTCKHLRSVRGDEAERHRVGDAIPRASKPRDSAGSGPPLLLAQSWDRAADLTGWWMSEKLDGVRAYWDGKTFISRLGNPYHAPDWFLEGMPAIPLDGELWGGRKKFQRTVSVVRRQDRSDHWKEIRYVVFDAPASREPFEQRIEIVRTELATSNPPYASFHQHTRCASEAELLTALARIEEQGGEGLMLRKPGSLYEAGRSFTLLKVKSFLDAEARVLEHLPGTGRHEGRLGALSVEMPGGVRFSVGTGFSDAERQSPPPIGSVITFRYQELSEGGVPRFPSYVAVRNDIALPPAATPKPGPKPKPGSTEATPPSAPGACRRFELVDGASSKFWEIEVSGATHTVRFGRIGAAGQASTKTFADAATAAAAAQKLVAEKIGKGYREV
ncbi:MAG: DNA ligase [Acidobacteriota bacterium]